MLTSSTVSRLRPLQAHHAAVPNNAFASSNMSPLRLRRPGQIRGFRFDMWSSYLDSTYDRELRRRYRTLMRKYAGMNRKLSWHEHPLSDDPRLALRRAVSRLWAPTATGCNSRWADQDKLDNRRKASSPPNPVSVNDDDFPWKGAGLWRLQRDQVLDILANKIPRDLKSQSEMEMKSEPPHVDGGAKKSNPESQQATRGKNNHSGGQDYVIDPITNRKVLQSNHEAAKTDLEPSTQGPKPLHPQFAQFIPPNLEEERQPVYSNGKPPASELSKYAENKFDDWPADNWDSEDIHVPRTATSNTNSTESFPSIHNKFRKLHSRHNLPLKSEEYSLNHLPLDDPIEEYDDLHMDQTSMPDKSLDKLSKGTKRHHAVDRARPQDSVKIDSFDRPSAKTDQVKNELQDYGPYMHNENSPVTVESKDTKELEKYQYHASEEPAASTEPPIVYDDLDKYAPTTFEDFKNQDQPFEQYGGLESYKTYRRQHHERVTPPERDTVAESLKEYEAKELDTGTADLDTYANHMPKIIPKMTLPDTHYLSEDSSTRTEAETLRQDADQLKEHADEIDFKYADTTWDSHGIEILPAGLSAIAKKSHGRETQRKNHKTEEWPSHDPSGATEKANPQSPREPPHHTSRLESALNRRLSSMKGNSLNRAFKADLYSKEPQGLETSFSKECGGRHTMPVYRRTYGSEPVKATSNSKPAREGGAQNFPELSSEAYSFRDPEIDGIPPSDQAQDRKAAQPDEPTVYKILAYDPNLQTVNVAETTSVVPDLASPLSPTEVLLRLSNPTKFFPHFAPLQSEGFEIISGGGDLLVFRQVRHPKVGTQAGATPVNPIDMMGRSTAVPNAAAFVSPTGFVNYDVPPVVEESAEPPFRSNINVRREEPVFSGQKTASRQREKEREKSQKSGRSTGEKVAIGGVWAAGIAYALGVVSEYFYTGGTDGKGPTGFSPL
ncbi:hypothetical protein F4678DRAFT_437733 [Xylaria arbuscula]|nr:hypothetical protein F4678DRAFT_437733 [Xylaria arbuscula]